MSKFQFWMIMWALMQVVSNTETNKGLESQYGFTGLIFLGIAIVSHFNKKAADHG